MQAGLVYAALAFVWWGLFPIYFRLVTTVPAPEVLSHRVMWCLLFLMVALTVRRQWGWLPQVLRQPKVLGAFTASALMIGSNWLCYIWSVNNGHVLEASLGYFITPLVNVLLGMTLLKERLRGPQWLALSVAGTGVVWLAWQAGHPPWIALLLAVTFGGYGLLRKVAVLGAIEGLTLETMLLAPLAMIVLGVAWQRGTGSFPAPDALTNLWMIALGPITAVPLLLFAAGARRLSMTTLGLMQYIGPTIQFMVALWIFKEPFSAERLVGFVLIWLALVIYTVDSWWMARTARLALAPFPSGRGTFR